MMKTHAYKVDRVMPREAANCAAVLTESLLQSSSKASSQLVKKFTAYDGTRTFVSLLTKAFWLLLYTGPYEFIFHPLTLFLLRFTWYCYLFYAYTSRVIFSAFRNKILLRVSHFPHEWYMIKLSPCSECCVLSFGWFPGIWILCADVSEHSVPFS